MSIFRFPKLQDFSTGFAGVRDRWLSRRRSTPSGTSFRRLLIDPLEERTLLSLTVGHVRDVLVNQVSTEAQTTDTSHAMAVDHDGDMVVAFTRNDEVLDAFGFPVIDPVTGFPMTDANIYARYFTDETQRLNLPSMSLIDADPLDADYGRMFLRYGGNEIQKISITATYEPFTFFQMNISGTFTLTFDDGVNLGTTDPITFFESMPFADNAQAIEDALRTLSLGADPLDPADDIAALYDVDVRGLNPHEYFINYGDASEGADMPMLRPGDQVFTTGFLPAIMVTTERQPVDIDFGGLGIPISPDNPDLTAQVIVQAFEQTYADVMVPPMMIGAPYFEPIFDRAGFPEVWVDVRSLTEFDITFVNNSGKIDHPLLKVVRLVADDGVTLVHDADDPDPAMHTVTIGTIKEPSPEFRVNEPEPDDPFTFMPDVLDQASPAVAVDADGEFIITWEGEVPDRVTFGSFVDIFARRFRPTAYQADLADVEFYVDTDLDGIEDPIQSVMPMGDVIRVNGFTTNAQFDPHVAMDDDGNYVIVWSNEGQDISFFNGIMAQRFNRDGERVQGEFLVNAEDTEFHEEPFVALSADGHFVIAWSVTSDGPWWPTPPPVAATMVNAKVFDPDGAVLIDQFQVTGGGQPTASFNLINDFVIGLGVVADNDNIGIVSNGAHAIMYDLYDDLGNLNDPLVVLRDEFRANSASFNPASPTRWPTWQGMNQVALDADGDLTIAFAGFGPDVSEDTMVMMDLYQQRLDELIDAGIIDVSLLDYFPFFALGEDFVPISFEGDVDDTIERVLYTAEREMLLLALPRDEIDLNLGQIRAILDEVAGMIRGEAFGIMFSQWDADPVLGPMNVITSDALINSMRDGHNTRYYLSIDTTTELRPISGDFDLILAHPDAGGALITFNPVFGQGQCPPLITGATMGDINNVLDNAPNTGLWWIPNPIPYEGPADVRMVLPSEIIERNVDLLSAFPPTYWAWPIQPGMLPGDAIYAITFQGEVHDTPFMDLLYAPGQWNRMLACPVAEIQTLIFNPVMPATDGWYALSMGGQTSPDLWFNAADPAAMVPDIQAALDGMYPGAVVRYVGDGTNWEYEVIFGGGSLGQDVPGIGRGNPQYAPDPANPPDLLWYGQIGSITLRQGNQSPPATNPVVDIYSYGDYGTYQLFPSIGLEPDGDFAAVWTQWDRYTSGITATNNIYMRTFNEVTDTAGPLVTDYIKLDGNRLDDGEVIEEPLKYVTVSFDEEMMTHGIHSVTDPSNWALLLEGVEVLGGISEVSYGLNMASTVGQLFGFNEPGGNKWEAVVVLDGNGMEAGVPPLGNGHYQLVAKRSLRDRSGNPLGRTGFDINGSDSDRGFEIDIPTGDETRVNEDPAGIQNTFPFSSGAIADDSDGDRVVVWTSVNTPGKTNGVYAKMYDVEWFDTPAGRTSVMNEMIVIDPATGLPWPDNEILVAAGTVLPTGELSASYGSVDRDADGDFVVTWSQFDSTNKWDVWARRYDASGAPIDDPFMVNSTTENIQRYSSVGMDTDGDFVITWQSLEQDGSGYGVYAQRYSPAGDMLGGTDETQLVRFVNNPRGTFSLYWDGDPSLPDETPPISYQGNTFDIVDDLTNAMAAVGADVDVVVISSTEMTITFVGAQGSANQPQLTLGTVNMTGDVGAGVMLGTLVDGQYGELQVNATTDNSQTFPSIGMDEGGTFVITWTSAGQDGDAPYQTNIYARQFTSNDAFRSTVTSEAINYRYKNWLENKIPGAEYSPFIVTTDNPANHLVPPGAGFDGVTMLTLLWNDGNTYLGSGTLLTTGRHILTAAHNVADNLGNLAAIDVDITFESPGGPIVLKADQIFVHPNYMGVPWVGGHDLAIIVLDADAPAGAERFDIYRGSNEIGQVHDKYGYGLSGQGATGVTLPPGTRRVGSNLWEGFGDLWGSYPDALAYDFDSGAAANDAFGVLYGINDVGLGNAEASGAPGDSGGPSYLGGLIAGVTSYGISIPGPHDVSPGLDSSFGDMGADVRVSLYADWIDSITSGSGGGEILVNQNIAEDQRWSNVALDSDGDFVISWNSYGQDGPGTGYGGGAGGLEGIFARRFDKDTAPASDEFQVNTFGEFDQQHSRVAMDADGDFAIVWESFQDLPLGPDGSPISDTPDSFGVFLQRYARTLLVGNVPFLGPNGEVGDETTVHTTNSGDQRYPGIAMSDTGDVMVVWSGNGNQPGQEDTQGVFYQRYDREADDSGPIVGDVLNVVAGGLEQVIEGDVLQANVTQFVITFGEEMSTESGAFGVNSVLNTFNYRLTRDGDTVFDPVPFVQFGISKAFDVGLQSAPSNKFEAVLTFDGDWMENGWQSLGRGIYQLTLLDAMEDIFDNALDGNYDGFPGGDFVFDFSILVGGVDTPPGPGDPPTDDVDDPINDAEIGRQDDPAVASNNRGDHVVAWVTYGDGSDAITEGDIIARRFDSVGRPLGAQFTVNSFRTGSQIEPDVAMDAFGNFVVTWSGAGEDDDLGVWAQVFNAFGDPVGDQFRVNEFYDHRQHEPSAAMDASGDFVITWTGYGHPQDDRGVYARLFNHVGQVVTGEFRLNTTTAHGQQDSDVAMDADGNFVVLWESWDQDGGTWGVVGRRYNASGSPRGGEFILNRYTTGEQLDPSVAMDPDGNFVGAWSSFLQDGSKFGIFGRRYSASGAARDPREFLVNQTTLYSQRQSAVDADNDGNFVFTWTSYGQDDPRTRDDGIYARMFSADGSPFVDPTTGQVLGQFRINANTQGNQDSPDIAVDSDGDFVVVWVGPDTDGTGIFSRIVGVNPMVQSTNNSGGSNPGTTTFLLNGTSDVDDRFEFIAGATLASSVLKINGVPRPIDPDAVTVVFDGKGGRDTVIITGTNGAETAELGPQEGTFENGSYTVTFENVEVISVDAGGGDDAVTLHDGSGDDTLEAWPDRATLTGPETDITVAGFETLVATATSAAGETNVAQLYDSDLDDVFVADPSYGELSGQGFSLRAENFDGVHAYSLAGGNDTAELSDSSGDDRYVGRPTEGILYRSGAYYIRAKYFAEVNAHASEGDDLATLEDSAGNDNFEAWPEYGTMAGGGFFHRAENFDTVRAIASEGIDVAKLFDSYRDDSFEAWPDHGVLSGQGFNNIAENFDGVHAYAINGGFDRADLYDSAEDNTVVGTSTDVLLYGRRFYNRAKYFEEVHAHTDAGGTDRAILYDAVVESGQPGDPVADVRILWLYDIEECYLASRSSNQEPVEQAVDDIFKAYWP